MTVTFHYHKFTPFIYFWFILARKKVSFHRYFHIRMLIQYSMPGFTILSNYNNYYYFQLGLLITYWHQVHLSPLRSTWSSSVTSAYISPIQSTLVYLLSIQSIKSTSVYQVHFAAIWSIRFILVHYVHWSTSFHFNLFQSITSTSVQFSSLRSNSVHFIHFGLFHPIWSSRSTSVQFGPFKSTSVQFSAPT